MYLFVYLLQYEKSCTCTLVVPNIYIGCYPIHISSTYRVLSNKYIQYISIVIQYIYPVYISIVIQYIYPVYIDCYPIHIFSIYRMLSNTYIQYIFNVSQDIYPVYIKCFPRYIPRCPIHMKKCTPRYMCSPIYYIYILGIYIGMQSYILGSAIYILDIYIG